MNAAIVKKEKNEVTFNYTVSPELFEEGLEFAYRKNKDRLQLPGFRKGKAPRKFIESQYGEEFFYNDGIDYVFNKEYENVIKHLDLDVVSRPAIDIKEKDDKIGILFEIVVTVKPEVTLGDYKGVEVSDVKIEVTDDEITDEIKVQAEKNSRKVSVTDRPAKEKDVVTISYLGSVDGVPFDGGQSDSHNLELGSNTFIEGFETQIIGHNVGDSFDVNVTFPEQYHAPDLAAKDAVFAVEIKEIIETVLPELDDEFAKEVSEFDTLNEYKESIKANIVANKEAASKQELSDKILDKAIENATMDVPEVMYEARIEHLLKDFENNLKRQGLNLEVYCQYMGTTLESMRDVFKDTAKKSVDGRLVLEKIAHVENIEVSEDELLEQIDAIGTNYGLKEGQMREVIIGEEKESLKNDIAIRKALEFIEENAVKK